MLAHNRNITNRTHFEYLELVLFNVLQEKGKKKETLNAVDTILGACETSWKLTVFLELLSRSLRSKRSRTKRTKFGPLEKLATVLGKGGGGGGSSSRYLGLGLQNQWDIRISAIISKPYHLFFFFGRGEGGGGTLQIRAG